MRVTFFLDFNFWKSKMATKIAKLQGYIGDPSNRYNYASIPYPKTLSITAIL